MNIDDVTVGMQVKLPPGNIRNYTRDHAACDTAAWRDASSKNQEFLYVSKVDGGRIFVRANLDIHRTSSFHVKDLEPYYEQITSTDAVNLLTLLNRITDL